jgi:ribosomal protein S18 acetylase RimI-like enzyme
MAITIRTIEEADVERAGDVNFVAFYEVAVAHGLPPTVTAPAESRSYVRHLLRFDPLGGVVATEDDGEVVGMAWVHPRGPVATIGPLAVDPRARGRGIGRRLLEGCIERAGPSVPQVRLVQESFNILSLGLYLRTGFRVVAPLLELELAVGQPVAQPVVPAGFRIRAATGDDRARLVTRDARAFGAPRPESIDLYLQRGHVLIAERGGVLAGYGLGIGFKSLAYLGSASADDPETLQLLATALTSILSSRGFAVRTLVPATDRRLVDGMTALGFRVFRACHYMVRGGGTAPPPNYVLMNGDMM